MISLAVTLWIVLSVIFFLSILFPYFSLLLSVPAIGVFIPAVMFTVQEENSRRQRGGKGLGPAGILAILTNLVFPFVFAIAVYAFRFIIKMR